MTRPLRPCENRAEEQFVWETTSEMPPPPALTECEAEIARLAADGLPCGEIASRLVISVNTVKTHLEHVYRKLGVRNRAQLARIPLETSKITRTGDRWGPREVQS